jgi:hypothetical protein
MSLSPINGISSTLAAVEPQKPAPAPPQPQTSSASSPSDSVTISHAARQASSAGDVDHDGDAH